MRGEAAREGLELGEDLDRNAVGTAAIGHRHGISRQGLRICIDKLAG
jgi:hypothetical protein